MSDYESPLDKILREARERGEFDDLPGKGKPIQWEDEALVPEDQRLANRLLKHNNFTLDWIELGQELEREYERARKGLELARAARAAGRLDEAGWKAAVGAFVKIVESLNLRVIGYNLRIPSEHFTRRPFPKDVD